MWLWCLKQTEKTLIRQLLQELPDLGLLCLQKCSHVRSHNSNMHVELSSGARVLIFSLRLHLHQHFVCASCRGSVETV